MITVKFEICYGIFEFCFRILFLPKIQPFLFLFMVRALINKLWSSCPNIFSFSISKCFTSLENYPKVSKKDIVSVRSAYMAFKTSIETKLTMSLLGNSEH